MHLLLRFAVLIVVTLVWSYLAISDDRGTQPKNTQQPTDRNDTRSAGNAQDNTAGKIPAGLLQEAKVCEMQGDQVREQVLHAANHYQSTSKLIEMEVRFYQCAIDAYTNAIARTPDNVEAYKLRGMVFAKRDQEGQSLLMKSHGGAPTVIGAIAEFGPEAIADLSHAIELAPKDAEAYYVRGKIYKLQFLNKYRIYFPPTDEATKAQVNLDTSLARSAVADFEKATAIDPHMGLAYEELGGLYLVCFRFSDAVASLRKAAECGIAQGQPFLETLDTLAKDPAIAAFYEGNVVGVSCSLE